jgi:hypothetical protein
MRHATAAMTLELYARLQPDDERRAVEALPSLAPTATEPKAAPAKGA